MQPDFGTILSPEMAHAMTEIRRRCEAAVKRESLLHYTDHTIDHLDQVAMNFIALAQPSRDTSAALVEYEYFVGLAACYYHDVALQRTIGSRRDVDRLEAYDYVMQRNQHGIAASNWIQQEVGVQDTLHHDADDPGPPPLGTTQSDTIAKLCLMAAPLCRHHCADPPAEPLKERNLLSQRIRMHLLLGLLRLADALHLDYNRVNMDLLKQHKLPVESELHWWRHHYTDSVSIDETGLIEIVMSFPGLSRPEQDFFENATFDYIMRELAHFKRTFRQHLITADILPITVDDGFSGLKREPSNELESYLVGLGKIPATLGDKASQTKIKAGRKRSRSFAEVQWGVKGHPWTDLPTSYVDEEFVETAEMRQYMDSVERFIESPKGEIRMVYGARGSGKTTFLHSIRDEFEGRAMTIYLDLSLVLGGVESATQLYAWLFGSLLDQLDSEHGPVDLREMPDMVRGCLSQVGGPVVILIDNMDRYLEQPDITTIRRFFQIAQRSLEDLRERCAVLITAHETWQEFLNEEDLSYLGAAPAWQLNAMKPAEIKELIDKRLQIAGSDYSRMFSPEAFHLIHRATHGNPRQVVTTCGYLFEEAIARHQAVIDDSFIREYVGTELGHRVHEALHQAALQAPVIGKLMAAGYRYHKAVELTPHTQNYAWTLIRNLYEVGQITLETVPEDLRQGFGELAELGTEGSFFLWKPSKPAARALELLKAQNLSLREFITTYQTKPIAPKGEGGEGLQVQAPRSLSHGSQKLAEMAKENEAKLASDDNSGAQALAARFALEYKILCFLQEANIIRPSSYEFHENGVIKVGGRHVRKYGWKHRRDFRAILDLLRKHPRHFKALPQMVLIDNDTYDYLENPTLPLADDDRELLTLCLSKALRDIDSALGQLPR